MFKRIYIIFSFIFDSNANKRNNRNKFQGYHTACILKLQLLS